MSVLVSHLVAWWAVIIFYAFLLFILMIVFFAILIRVRDLEKPNGAWTFTTFAEVTTVVGLLVVFSASIFAIRDRVVTTEANVSSLQTVQGSLNNNIQGALDNADEAAQRFVDMSATVGDLVARVTVLERIGAPSSDSNGDDARERELQLELERLSQQLQVVQNQLEEFESRAVFSGTRVALQGISNKYLFDNDRRGRDELDVFMGGEAQAWTIRREQ